MTVSNVAVAVDLSPERARILTDSIRSSVENLWGLLVKAWQGRAWLALGYESWDAYLDGELGDVRMRLPREDRREAVASMREAGMSTRAIGAALGVSVGTVHEDGAGVQNRTPAPVTGLDGKTYQPRTKPIVDSAPEPDVIDAEIVDDEPPTPRDSKPRVDVASTISRALMRAREAASAAEQITPTHLRGRSDEAAVWSRDLATSVRALQRLLADLEGVK